MLGLMQDWALTVDKILTHAKTWHGHREVVTRTVEGPIVRATWADRQVVDAGRGVVRRRDPAAGDRQDRFD
jgi:hypothetical protein